MKLFGPGASNTNLSTSRRNFLAQMATSVAATALLPIPQLAQAQEAQTLKDKLCNEEPQKCLEKFLDLILEDPSIKGKITQENFQIISGLNKEKEGLTELYQEAKKQAEKQKLPKARLEQISKDLLINLIINQQNQTGSTMQSFNIGSIEEPKRLLVVPYGPNTSNNNSPFNAIQKIISEALMMVEIQKAAIDFMKMHPEKDLETMPDILIPVVEHLEKAKALAESITKTIAGKHGKSEPLLKDIQDEVINPFEKQIQEMKTREKKIQKQLQNIFNPQRQEAVMNEQMPKPTIATAGIRNTPWRNFISAAIS